MLVYLVRHAKAHADSPTGRDEDRELTPRGHAQAQWLAQRLLTLEHRPELLLSSPATRARQTAQALANALAMELTFVPELSPRHELRDYLSVIEAHADRDCIALVAHNMTLEELASTLLDGHGVGFATGQATLIELLPDSSRLLGTWRLSEE